MYHHTGWFVCSANQPPGLILLEHLGSYSSKIVGCDTERANPATSPSSPQHSASRSDLASLHRDVSMGDVPAALGGHEAYHGFGAQKPRPCPICRSAEGKRHRSFSVHLDCGIYRCLHPHYKAQGTVLDFLTTCRGIRVPEAARDLTERFAPHLIPSPN